MVVSFVSRTALRPQPLSWCFFKFMLNATFLANSPTVVLCIVLFCDEAIDFLFDLVDFC